VVARLLCGGSGDAIRPADGGAPFTVPKGKMLRDRFVLPDQLPGWLTEDDLDFYTAEFERSGFRGPLNRYRNVDRDWKDLTAWRGLPISVPSLFIGGEKDGPTIWGAGAIARYPRRCRICAAVISSRLRSLVQQERPDRVNELLTNFLGSM